MADQRGDDEVSHETESALARPGEVVDEEVVGEEGASGRRWGIACLGIIVGIVLGTLGIVLDRPYLVYLGVGVFIIFAVIAAGANEGQVSIPGLLDGSGSFPRRRLRRRSQGGEIRGLPKRGKPPPKGPDDDSSLT